ncbi:hypothetical protein BDR26DRAFT_922444 [Obelidium mucronatum]|nr:hypothetical protein BDR26DRAFT_922444 [Obelidium mucronatum]
MRGKNITTTIEQRLVQYQTTITQAIILIHKHIPNTIPNHHRPMTTMAISLHHPTIKNTSFDMSNHRHNHNETCLTDILQHHFHHLTLIHRNNNINHQQHPPPPHVTTTPLTTTTNTSVITPSPSTVSPDSQKSIQNDVTSSMQTPQQEFLNDANNNHDSKDYRQLQHYDNHYYHHPHHPHHSHDQGHYYHHQQRHDYANHPRYENHHFGY